MQFFLSLRIANLFLRSFKKLDEIVEIRVYQSLMY